ncbi:MAG: AbgT family transporter [Phycisphaerae bacterium]|nr:AbgT family transporter [Phycisphaerae bacterium]MBN8596344.1 AbgT family transporter [Planctomycetota bacterium]
MQKILDVVERVGNKVPHPVIIFLGLIAIVLIVAHILTMAGASVTYQTINPETNKIEETTTTARSLLNVEGIRFMYSTLIPNFMGFTAVGLMIVAMVGAGVAEESGLVKALIRKLVIVSPPKALTYILVFAGILSSVAADAGYLVLIPLAGIAFISIGRHPLAGLAAGFASVAGAFTVNMLIKPLDAVLTEFTNDAIHMVNPAISIDLTANVWFSIVSVLFLTIVITLITERIIEPRLGEYKGDKPDGEEGAKISPDEARGLKYALLGLIGVLAVFALLCLPSGAPLRNPTTGALIGNSPFMNGLIAFIMILFLVTGAAFGLGAKTLKGVPDIIKAMEKAISNLGGLILLLLIISQFIAYFNYTNMATIMAVKMADGLKGANIGPLWLLLGFIVVVAILDLLITGAIAKWAIFAPVFVPVFIQLGVAPESVLAAYRIADSPINMITPLNAYFVMVVAFAQKYDKNAGVGTLVALMLPYVVGIFVLWTALFVVWYLLGLPWGL